MSVNDLTVRITVTCDDSVTEPIVTWSADTPLAGEVRLNRVDYARFQASKPSPEMFIADAPNDDENDHTPRSYHVARRRVAFLRCANITLRELADTLCEMYLASEGITLVDWPAAPTIAEVLWNGKNVHEALAWLALQAHGMPIYEGNLIRWQYLPTNRA